MSTIQESSELLFLYETSYNIPNGDPFTGEQRYDEETKKILVSDVRIKRFVRSYLQEIGEEIFVDNKEGNDAKSVLESKIKKSELSDTVDVGAVMRQMIDVRLFGGISTLKNDGEVEEETKLEDGTTHKTKKKYKNGHIQFTGPVQFSLLNPSLNRVNMRMHQNTSHFSSDKDKSQGTIGTTTVVPYSVMQIHGWVNPSVAKTTGMTKDDKQKLCKGLWYGTSGNGSSFSRSKIGQDSLLLLEIVYKEPHTKIYGVDRLIKITPKDSKKEEELRSMDDYDFDFSKLIEALADDKVVKVRYYTEIKGIEKSLMKIKIKDGQQVKEEDSKIASKLEVLSL